MEGALFLGLRGQVLVDDGQKIVDVEGLHDEIVGLELFGDLRGGHVGRDEDDGNVLSVGVMAEFFEEVSTIAAANPDIEEDEVRVMLGDGSHDAIGAIGDLHCIALGKENGGQSIEDVSIVFDN